MLYYRTRCYTLPHIRVVLQSFNKLAMRVSSWSQSKKKKKKKKIKKQKSGQRWSGNWSFAFAAGHIWNSYLLGKGGYVFGSVG